MLLPILRLKTPRNSRHPWIFRKMVQPRRGAGLEPGSLVEVRDRSGAFVGRAFYHPENTIALRLLTENPAEEIDPGFFLRRLALARDLRQATLDLPRLGDSWRLAHAEADALPGMMIDKYADTLLIQPFAAGWLHVMDWLIAALAELFPDCRPAIRADARAAEKEGVSFADLERKYPPPSRADISENGIKYRVDFGAGHKTGFFLDQRDNRARAAGLARGRDVLDLCSYSGGFALSAWKGGARAVEAVDLDEAALAAAAENLRLNRTGGKIRLTHADAFEVCRQHRAAGRRHDLVILDPPKLAGSLEETEKALKTYYDLNLAALGVAAPGGFFITCSCSGAVPEERWRQQVRRAAAAAGLGLTIFHAGGPGADHPVASDFPQGRYLKALFARVDGRQAG
ncbi:MAG: class I SAM-dependent rRNA methyltransferase [Planctomycetota bacterium]|nr:class I SAM-dependent rRNA methyltransferase [Planctomycetota bacterium]